jgi:hypothetical protein
MTDDSGTTVGVWIPEDSDLIEQFDREVCSGEARSKQIREAMDLLLTVEDVLSTAGMDLSGRERRMFVRQALLDQIRRERE